MATMEHVNRITGGGAGYVELPSSRLAKIINHPLPSTNVLSRLSHAIGSHDCVYFFNAYAFQDMLFWLTKNMTTTTPIISAQHASMFHDDLLHDFYVRTITRLFLQGFSAYHVLNKEDYETYTQWGLEDVFLIPNGVNTDRFSPPASRDTSEFRVLHVGRLEYQKGIDILIESIKILNSEISKSQLPEFRICGTGPLADKVEGFSKETSNVSYLGFVSEKELLNQYQQATLFVMPSRRETFGLVAMEAMSCGAPVITSDIPGPRTFVEKEYGAMIPPSNPRALAQAIERFYTLWKEQPATYRSMGRLAREKCVQEYSWNRIVDRLIEMIRTVSET
jgi:glycosyltransferase involved in cell wall biosynthesis